MLTQSSSARPRLRQHRRSFTPAQQGREARSHGGHSAAPMLRGLSSQSRRIQCCTKDLYSGWKPVDAKAAIPEQAIGTAVIIGGGASGLVAALGLAKFGMAVQVFDSNEIGTASAGAETAIAKLTPETIGTLQGLGMNVHSKEFGDIVFTSAEKRVLDCLTTQPEVAPLPAAELYTTYGLLKRFIRQEVERMSAGRIHFSSGVTLLSEEGVNAEERTVTLSSPDGSPTVHRFDLLVGADGARSLVRQSLIKRERRMKSMLSYVGPMRYVTALRLEAQPAWMVPSTASMTSSPLESLMEAPLVDTAARQVTLASPLVFLGQPLPEWGLAKYYKIKLTVFQDPEKQDEYCGSFEGSQDLFDDLADIVDAGGQAALEPVLRKLFMNLLPASWVAAIATALARTPEGFSHGATVVASHYATPNASAVAIVGDAAHATSWRLGYSLQNALMSAALLGHVMLEATSLSTALQTYTERRAPDMAALGQLDRLAPVFLGEYAAIGPLRTVLQLALFLRLSAHRVCRYFGVNAVRHPSFISALASGMSPEVVWKMVRRETTIAVSIVTAAFYCFVRYMWTVYSNNAYRFA